MDKRYRDGASTFSLLTAQEIEEGCKRIEQDIRSGRAAEVIAAFDQEAASLNIRVVTYFICPNHFMASPIRESLPEITFHPKVEKGKVKKQ